MPAIGGMARSYHQFTARQEKSADVYSGGIPETSVTER
jgi:hypothetical protein